MSDLKTFVLGIVALFATTVQAEQDEDLLRTFANCAGRFSAEVEHAWLIGNTDPDPIALRRDATIALLDAVTTEPRSAHAMDLRIRAKHAHARLLLTASFHLDPLTAARSRRLAATRIHACSSLLLG